MLSILIQKDIENYYLGHKKQGSLTPSADDKKQWSSSSISVSSMPTISSILIFFFFLLLPDMSTPDMISDVNPGMADIPGLTREDVKALFSLIETIAIYSVKLEEQIAGCLVLPHMTEEIGMKFIEMVLHFIFLT